ncbi:MAG: IclR family transcriptional regulator [Antricoccus sp.]
MADQVPAVTRALSVLKLLSSSATALSANRIAEVIGLPRSSAYHLLSALQQDGFVMYLPEVRRYSLGLAAVELGSAFSQQASLSLLGNPVLAALMRKLRLPVHLGLLHGREVLYLVEQRPPRSSSLVTAPDVRLPAHLTASGRAMLALLPQSQVSALYAPPHAFTTRTGEGPRSMPALRRVLALERDHGYSCERGEVTAGFHSVAVACLDRHGLPIASIAVTYRARDGVPEEVVSHSRRAAREISHRIGAVPGN